MMSDQHTDTLAWVLGIPDSNDFVAKHLGVTWSHFRNDNRDRFADLLPEPRVAVELSHVSTHRRRLRLVPVGERAQALMTELQASEAPHPTLAVPEVESPHGPSGD